ncbi:MAG: ABC transporter permease [Saprospiraceae bacterium]|nr:ABC transporter permease [Candidatus Vicinibacter proximus]MCC6844222.1 ABC transporter permease [Saprospiraceae bacterium]
MNLSRFLATRTYSAFNQSLIRNIIRIAMISTALSLSVVIVSSSVFEGFQKLIAQKVFGFWGHIHITDMQVNRSIEPYAIKHSDSIKALIKNADFSSADLSSDVIRKLESFVVLPAIVGIDAQYDGLFLKGIEADFDWAFLGQFLKSGRLPELSDSLFSRDILISEQTALKLSLKPDQSILANFVIDGKQIKRKLKVCGTYRTGLEEYDRKFALVDIRMLQQVLQWSPDEVTAIEVFAQDIQEVSALNMFLYEEILPSNLYSETIREKFPNIFEWLSLQDINKRFIIGLILLVCIINMSTTLLILILERTHMIGLLSALGMRSWDQRKVFVRYGIKILTKGMLFGNIIGIGLCLIQWKWKLIKLSEADYYLDHAPVSLNPWTWLVVNLIFFVVISASLLIPSYLVAKIKPVNALKFR